jgi:hypothetical protein
MKRWTLGLSIAIVAIGTSSGPWGLAAFAQSNPNTPTGPNNPNPPSQLTGSLAPTPCGVGANIASNGIPAPPPVASPGASQGAQTGTADNKPSTNTGCTTPDRPAGAPMPAPAPATTHP